MTSSTNQLLKPVTTQVNSLGNIEIGGCDTVDLAEKYLTPLYVIDEKTLRSICRDYKKAFEKYPKTHFMYASKALCISAIAKIVDEEGFGFDTVSAGEIYTVYKAGIDMSHVLFNGNNKSYSELELAVELGVGRFSVDNFWEVRMLNGIAELKGKVVDVLLRITPGIECHTHEYIQTGHLDSKFGFDLTQIDKAIEIIVEDCPNIAIHGLHAHVGSQIFETEIYPDEIEILAKEISRLDKKFGLKLNEVNIGGGLGVKYTQSDNPPSTSEIAEKIINKLNEVVEKYGIEYPTVFLEPGRSIISTAGVTLYSVGSSKQVPHGTKYVALDGGMADNPRPSMYQAQYVAEVANKKDLTKTEKVTLAGRYCESGDILIKDIELPELFAGDVVCVYNTGAYNYSMASNYNRVEKPAMVLVNESKSEVIVKRETLDDLIAHDIIPDRLRK
jgi:diaminopimelate decarboxylase